MDDLTLFGETDDQIDSLVQTVLEHGVVILKKGKLVKFDGINLPNQEIMKAVDENGYTYLGILD